MTNNTTVSVCRRFCRAPSMVKMFVHPITRKLIVSWNQMPNVTSYRVELTFFPDQRLIGKVRGNFNQPLKYGQTVNLIPNEPAEPRAARLVDTIIDIVSKYGPGVGGGIDYTDTGLKDALITFATNTTTSIVPGYSDIDPDGAARVLTAIGNIQTTGTALISQYINNNASGGAIGAIKTAVDQLAAASSGDVLGDPAYVEVDLPFYLLSALYTNVEVRVWSWCYRQWSDLWESISGINASPPATKFNINNLDIDASYKAYIQGVDPNICCDAPQDPQWPMVNPQIPQFDYKDEYFLQKLPFSRLLSATGYQNAITLTMASFGQCDDPQILSVPPGSDDIILVTNQSADLKIPFCNVGKTLACQPPQPNPDPSLRLQVLPSNAIQVSWEPPMTFDVVAVVDHIMSRTLDYNKRIMCPTTCGNRGIDTKQYYFINADQLLAEINRFKSNFENTYGGRISGDPINFFWQGPNGNGSGSPNFLNMYQEFLTNYVSRILGPDNYCCDTRYVVQYRVRNAQTWNSLPPTTSDETTAVVSCLDPNQSYQFRIYTLCGDSQYSNALEYLDPIAPNPCTVPNSSSIDLEIPAELITPTSITVVNRNFRPDFYFLVEYRAMGNNNMDDEWISLEMKNTEDEPLGNLVLHGLDSNATYQIRYIRVCRCKTKSVASPTITVTTLACPELTEFNLEMLQPCLTTNSASFLFRPYFKLDNYTMRYRSVGSDFWYDLKYPMFNVLEEDPTIGIRRADTEERDLFITLEHLNQNTEYEIELAPVCNNCFDNVFKHEFFTLKCEPPQMMVQANDMTTITLQLDTVSELGECDNIVDCPTFHIPEPRRYKVMYRQAVSGDECIPEDLNSYSTVNREWDTETTVTISGLLPDTFYEIRSEALCDADQVSIGQTTIQNTLPCNIPILGLRITEDLDLIRDTVTLRWEADFTNQLRGYRVEYRILNTNNNNLFQYETPTDWITIADRINENGYTVTGVIFSSTEYVFRVSGLCGNNVYTDGSETQRFTTLDCPDYTDGALGEYRVIPEQVSHTSVVIEVPAVSGANFVIQHRKVTPSVLAEPTFRVQDFVPFRPNQVARVNNVFTIGGLEPGTNYQFLVRSQCGTNFSNGVVLEAQTESCFIGVNPLHIDFVADMSVGLSWDAIQTVDAGYTITYYEANNSNNSNSLNTFANSVTISNDLRPNTEYIFEVTTTCGEAGALLQDTRDIRVTTQSCSNVSPQVVDFLLGRDQQGTSLERNRIEMFLRIRNTTSTDAFLVTYRLMDMAPTAGPNGMLVYEKTSPVTINAADVTDVANRQDLNFVGDLFTTFTMEQLESDYSDYVNGQSQLFEVVRRNDNNYVMEFRIRSQCETFENGQPGPSITTTGTIVQARTTFSLTNNRFQVSAINKIVQ